MNSTAVLPVRSRHDLIPYITCAVLGTVRVRTGRKRHCIVLPLRLVQPLDVKMACDWNMDSAVFMYYSFNWSCAAHLL
jgi:hypothetical protein